MVARHFPKPQEITDLIYILHTAPLVSPPTLYIHVAVPFSTHI